MPKVVPVGTHITYIFYRWIASFLIQLLEQSFWQCLSIATIVVSTVAEVRKIEVTKNVSLFSEGFTNEMAVDSVIKYSY